MGLEVGVRMEILERAVDLELDLGLQGRRLRAKRKMGMAAKDVECQGTCTALNGWSGHWGWARR
jgi:hypothetical protein